MERKNYTVAIDLGCSSVVVAVGEKTPEGELSVVSLVSKPSEGVKAGQIENIELVSRSIRAAVSETEEQLGIRITEAYAGISGDFVRCARHTDHVFVYDPQNGVNQHDVDALFDRMRNVQAPDDESIMERVPQNYMVDDNQEVRNPVGSFGKKLSSTFNFILCQKTPMQRLDMALKRLGIRLLGVVSDAMATPEAVLLPDEKEEGVAVVDIGAGDIVYDPTFEDLGGSYYLSGDPVDEVMGSLGLNGLLTMADGYYIPVALVLKNVTETEIDLVPLLMNYVDGSLVYVNDLVITEIGTAALPYVDEYIESGKIPVADAGPLGDAILEAAEGLNYTITASGAFYEDGTDTLIADADLPSYSTLSDFYAAGKLERQMLFTSDGMYVESCMYDDYGGGFTPSNYGYLNHVDGYVCTFTMEDGVAVMGSKDEDPYFGTTTEAPFYDTYGGNLSVVTLESIEGAGLTPDGEDPNLYHYVYANDINATGDYWYDMSFGSFFMEPLYGDMLSLYLDDSQGSAMMWDMTMDLRLEDDGSISFEIVLPTPIDETTTVDFVIDGSISDIGTTVIPGLSDILDDEPEPSDPWGDWYY